MTDDLLRELGKELPYERPDDARREGVRASLLAAASRREELPPQRWRVFAAFGAGALAAAAIAMVVIGRRAPVARVVESARIESSSAAQLEHTVATTATGTDEIVRVHAGVIRVALAPVKAGDRVAIATADAEVAGAGAYEVAVRDDKLAAVTVTSGAAKVTVAGHQAVFLAAGETWHSEVWTADAQLTQPPESRTPDAIAAKPDVPRAISVPPSTITATTTAPKPDALSTIATPAATKTDAPATAPKANVPLAITTPNTDTPMVTAPIAPASKANAPTSTTPKTDAPAVTAPKTDAPTNNAPAVATSVAPPVETRPAPSRTEQHFQHGWKLLKDGKAIEAANELAIAAEGDGPIAVDARYFQAEALVKAGRKTEAEKALVGFLDHAQQSLRRGRAAVMLARLIAERGDKAAARNWFQSAVGDPDPAVAAAAKAGLAAL